MTPKPLMRAAVAAALALACGALAACAGGAESPESEQDAEVAEQSAALDTAQTAAQEAAAAGDLSELEVAFALDATTVQNEELYDPGALADLRAFTYELTFGRTADGYACTVSKHDAAGNTMDAAFDADDQLRALLQTFVAGSSLLRTSGQDLRLASGDESYGSGSFSATFANGSKLSGSNQVACPFSASDLVTLRDLFLDFMDRAGAEPDLSSGFVGYVSPEAGSMVRGHAVQQATGMSWTHEGDPEAFEFRVSVQDDRRLVTARFPYDANGDFTADGTLVGDEQWQAVCAQLAKLVPMADAASDADAQTEGEAADEGEAAAEAAGAAGAAGAAEAAGAAAEPAEYVEVTWEDGTSARLHAPRNMILQDLYTALREACGVVFEAPEPATGAEAEAEAAPEPAAESDEL